MKIDLTKVLFLDIETASVWPSYEEMPELMRKWWDRKTEYLRKQEGDDPASLFTRAGIYSEFAKVICVVAGRIVRNADGEPELRMKSYIQEEEKDLLTAFASDLDRWQRERRFLFLCAHNGKEFDFPFLARRMVIQHVKLPLQLDNHGKKPWEINHLDTMDLWKFGDYKHFTSLELLATVLGIPSPKNDLEGSEVGGVYWKDKDLPRIEKYCRNDVATVAQIMLRFQGEDIIPPERIGEGS